MVQASTTKMGPSQAVCLLQDGFTECFEDMGKDNLDLHIVVDAQMSLMEESSLLQILLNLGGFVAKNAVSHGHVQRFQLAAHGNLHIQGVMGGADQVLSFADGEVILETTIMNKAGSSNFIDEIFTQSIISSTLGDTKGSFSWHGEDNELTSVKLTADDLKKNYAIRGKAKLSVEKKATSKIIYIW